jgi:hypothetical protein
LDNPGCGPRTHRNLLHPKHGAGLHLLYAFGVLSIVYTDSGRLLPLTAIGAGIDFIHIFRTVGRTNRMDQTGLGSSLSAMRHRQIALRLRSGRDEQMERYVNGHAGGRAQAPRRWLPVAATAGLRPFSTGIKLVRRGVPPAQ